MGDASGILKRRTRKAVFLSRCFKERPIVALIDHRHLWNVDAVVRIETPAGDEQAVADLSHKVAQVIAWAVAAESRGGGCQVEGGAIERNAHKTLAVASNPEIAFPVEFQPIDTTLQRGGRCRGGLVVELEQGALIETKNFSAAAHSQLMEREQVNARKIVRAGFFYQSRSDAPRTHGRRLSAGDIEVNRVARGCQVLHGVGEDSTPQCRVGNVLQHADGFHALLGGHEQVVVDSDDIVAAGHCEMPFEFSPCQVDPSKALVGGEKSVIALHAKSSHGQFFHRRLLDSGEIHELSVCRPIQIDVTVRVKEHQPSARGGVADVFNALVR